jgi:hypothetical protein
MYSEFKEFLNFMLPHDIIKLFFSLIFEDCLIRVRYTVTWLNTVYGKIPFSQ